ncbi:peptidyl-prolyl cis-trans isomerase [Peniophora sp. CONT]|nr:peptidyl-prolyl cis-trans isomerase [Peniophora sp. CONT]
MEILQCGNGVDFPKAHDQIKVHYVGKLADGHVFASTRDRNEPYVGILGVGRLIKGWDDVIPKLSLNSKALLTVPPHMAYGSRGFSPVIPPNATLVFEIELLQIN